MAFPKYDNVRTAIELADAAGRLVSSFAQVPSKSALDMGAPAVVTKLLALSLQAITVKDPAKAEAIELVVTHSAESAATDEQALDEELARGQVAALAIVRHALGMGTNKCSIPVKLDGASTYLVNVSPADRSPEDEFGHFLTYSGLHGCSVAVKDLMFKAFQAGQ